MMSSDRTIPCGGFELIETVGSGGMGQVWKARHAGLEETVAVKVIARDYASDEGHRRRFRREVQAHAGLRHPGIASVFDYGRIDPTAADLSEGELAAGSPYLVMEFAEEGTLADGGIPRNWEELRSLLLQMLDALAYAHARNVVHRDLKPGNVLAFGRRRERTFKIADFGVAYSLTASRDEGAREFELTIGTPEFMAPEQFQGQWRDFGPWTDLYALGCMTYRMVCRRHPFEGETVTEVASGHLEEDLPPVEPVYAVPRDFVAWLRRMTARSPSLRFRRAADAARTLLEMPEVDGSSVPSLPDGAGDTVGIDPSTTLDVDTHEDGRPEVIEGTSKFPGSRDSQSMVPPTMPETGEKVVIPEDPDTVGAVPSSTERRPSEAGGRRRLEMSSIGPTVDPVLPGDWRPGDAAVRDAMRETGLGLFGLREVPFIDRDAARDRMWARFRQTVRGNGPSVIVIRGRSGTGKSRLAEWMARRAHEVGAVRLVRGNYRRQGAHREGLVEVVERMMTLWELDRREIHRRAHKKISQWYPSERTEEYLDREASAVTEFVEPGNGAETLGPTYHFDAVDEKYALVGRLLEYYARERPVVVWLDDVQWGDRAIDFARHVIENDRNRRLCLIMTVRSDELDEATGKSLESLHGLERTTDVELDALEERHHVELVRNLLPLEEELVGEVVDRTAGNPLFAVQLVGDWVDRALLERGDDGFELTEEAKEGLPEDIQQLWQTRVEQIVETVGGDEEAEVAEALEIAAAFGEQVDENEWSKACEIAGVAPVEALPDALVDRGLARREPNGWRFVHGMLVESLEGESARRDRFEAHHLACAEAIEALYPGRAEDVLSRRAEHLLAAEAWEEALEPLLEAARDAENSGRLRRCRELLEKRARALDELGVDAEGRRRVENWLGEARVKMLNGREEEAGKLGRRARDVASRRDWPDLLGRALEYLALETKIEGQLEESLQFAERAQACFDRSDNRKGWADCEMTRAHVFQCWSRYAKARAALERASRCFQDIDDEHAAMRAVSRRNYCLIYEQRFDQARRSAHDLLDHAEEHGNAKVEAHGWNQLGEIARFEGRWERARDCYESAYHVWNRTGSADRNVVWMNIAFVEMAAGKYVAASEKFAELEQIFEEGGWGRMLPNVYLGMLACAAGRGEWHVWDAVFERVVESFDEVDNRERDHGWLVDVAAELTEEQCDGDRSRDILEFAADLWRDLGEHARVRDIEQHLDDLGSRGRQ